MGRFLHETGGSDPLDPLKKDEKPLTEFRDLSARPGVNSDAFLRNILEDRRTDFSVGGSEGIGRSPGVSNAPGSLLRVFRAAFSGQNLFVNANRAAILMDADEKDEGFDPFTEGNLKGYEAFVGRFIGVRSLAENELVKRNIDLVMKEAQLVETAQGFLPSLAAGAGGLLGFMTSPALLVPITRIPAVVAAFTAQEAILHATRVNRTGLESFINIGAAGFLGFALKTARTYSQASHQRGFDKAFRDLERDVDDVGDALFSGGTSGPPRPGGPPRTQVPTPTQSPIDGINMLLRDMRVAETVRAKPPGTPAEFLSGLKKETPVLQKAVDDATDPVIKDIATIELHRNLDAIQSVGDHVKLPKAKKPSVEKEIVSRPDDNALNIKLIIENHLAKMAEKPVGVELKIPTIVERGAALLRIEELNLKTVLSKSEIDEIKTLSDIAEDLEIPSELAATTGERLIRESFTKAGVLEKDQDLLVKMIGEFAALEAKERELLAKLAQLKLTGSLERVAIVNEELKNLRQQLAKVDLEGTKLVDELTGRPEAGARTFAEGGKIVPDEPVDPKSVGAESLGGPSLTPEEQLAQHQILDTLLNDIPDSPAKTTLLSTELLVRETTLDLVESALFLQMHLAGIPSPVPVENLMRRWWWPTAEATVNTNALYNKYRTGFESSTIMGNLRQTISDAIRGRGDALSEQSFNEEIGWAMHTGDVHDIPEVQEAAQVWRKVADTFNKELIDNEVYIAPLKKLIRRHLENAKTAPRQTARRLRSEANILQKAIDDFVKNGPQFNQEKSYFPLVFRHDLVIEKMTELRAVLLKHYSKTLKGNVVHEAVEATIVKILRDQPFVPIDEDAVGMARALRQRVLDVPVELLRPFIELDAGSVWRWYTRTVSADIELTKKFGDNTIADRLAEIAANFDARIQAEPNSKALVALMREKGEMITILRGLRDRLRGTFGLPDDPYRVLSRVYKSVKNFSYITSLGGVAIASIPDLGSIILQEGITGAFKDGFGQLVKNFAGMKLNTKEAKIAGVAMEMEMGFRAQSLSDTGDTFGRHTMFEKWLADASEAFSLINLFNPWNAMMKGVAANVISSRILEDSLISSATYLRSLETKVTSVKGLTDESGTAVAAYYNRNTNTVFLDEAQLEIAFQRGVWFHGRELEVGQQIDPLPPGIITNRKSWRNYVLENELARADFPQPSFPPDRLTPAAYENRLNRIAVNRILIRRANRGRKMTRAEQKQDIASGGTGESLSVWQRAVLARAGIGPLDADAIARMFEEFGTFNGDIMLPNTAAWNNQAAVDAFRSALSSDVERTIVTPGAGDIPFFFSNELGSVIFQFKSFIFAILQKVVIPAMQKKDQRVVIGLMVMIGLGMLVDELRRQQRGDKRQINFLQRVIGGIDRSGVTGYFSDLNRIVESISDNRLGIDAMVGGESYRPSFESKTGAILGPSAGQFARIARVLSDVGSGEYNYHTAGALRRTIPTQNVVWMLPFWDAVEEGARF